MVMHIKYNEEWCEKRPKNVKHWIDCIIWIGFAASWMEVLFTELHIYIVYSANYAENSLDLCKINYHNSRGSCIRLLHISIHISFDTWIDFFLSFLRSIDHPTRPEAHFWIENSIFILCDVEMVVKSILYTYICILEECEGRHAAQ